MIDSQRRKEICAILAGLIEEILQDLIIYEMSEDERMWWMRARENLHGAMHNIYATQREKHKLRREGIYCNAIRNDA